MKGGTTKGTQMTEQTWEGSNTETGGSLSILVSHSARREVTVFQCCLHSLPVCRKHPEDAAGTHKHTLHEQSQKTPHGKTKSSLSEILTSWGYPVFCHSSSKRWKDGRRTTISRENYRLKDKKGTKSSFLLRALLFSSWSQLVPAVLETIRLDLCRGRMYLLYWEVFVSLSLLSLI